VRNTLKAVFAAADKDVCASAPLAHPHRRSAAEQTSFVNSIVDEKELPMRLTALTPCFRAEAGAAGRDTRGMIRQHQFTKVELVFDHDAGDQPGRARAHAGLRRGGAAAARSALPRDDAVRRRMGFAAQKTYDIEVWMPGTIFESGRGRRLPRNLKLFGVRRFPGPAHGRALSRARRQSRAFVPHLNGSGTAVGRALIAVMETYQQEDGLIAVPDVHCSPTWAG